METGNTAHYLFLLLSLVLFLFGIFFLLLQLIRREQKKNLLVLGSFTFITSYCLLLLVLQGLDKGSDTAGISGQKLEKKLSVVASSKAIEVPSKPNISPSLKTQRLAEPTTQTPAKISTTVITKRGGKTLEGILWIDRVTSKCFVNRGKSDGIYYGASVDIYDGTVKIGEARIIEVFDVISYAELIKKTPDDFAENSYRIHIFYDQS